MADFNLIMTGGFNSAWIDDATPSRTFALPGLPHRYRWAALAAGGNFVFQCVVGGVVAPLDAALGGRLFSWSWVDVSAFPLPPLVTPVGQSSELTLLQSAFLAGHYTLLASRTDGGGDAMSFEIEP